MKIEWNCREKARETPGNQVKLRVSFKNGVIQKLCTKSSRKEENWKKIQLMKNQWKISGPKSTRKPTKIQLKSFWKLEEKKFLKKKYIKMSLTQSKESLVH